MVHKSILPLRTIPALKPVEKSYMYSSLEKFKILWSIHEKICFIVASSKPLNNSLFKIISSIKSSLVALATAIKIIYVIIICVMIIVIKKEKINGTK